MKITIEEINGYGQTQPTDTLTLTVPPGEQADEFLNLVSSVIAGRLVERDAKRERDADRNREREKDAQALVWRAGAILLELVPNAPKESEVAKWISDSGITFVPRHVAESK